jgi:hypothetical protein
MKIITKFAIFVNYIEYRICRLQEVHERIGNNTVSLFSLLLSEVYVLQLYKKY